MRAYGQCGTGTHYGDGPALDPAERLALVADWAARLEAARTLAEDEHLAQLIWAAAARWAAITHNQQHPTESSHTR